jgi:hypothetical protein
MIKPGQVSDGMFDLTDFFVTSLALAGALDKLPSENYVDGIDQSAFLLADGGQTKRKTTFCWSALTAIREPERLTSRAMGAVRKR